MSLSFLLFLPVSPVAPEETTALKLYFNTSLFLLHEFNRYL